MPRNLTNKGVSDRKRILGVDDDELIRELIRSVLGDAGFHCECVPGGEKALELLKSGEKFDLVTTDITNAPMEGIGFLERMKNAFPETPVMVITGFHDPQTASECRTRGACDYVLKPFTRQQLLEAVFRAVEYRP